MKGDYITRIICTFVLPVFAATEKWIQMTKCHTEVDPAWTSLATLTVSDRLQCAWACYMYSNCTCDHVSFHEGTCILWQGEATCGSSSGVQWTVYKVCRAGWYRYHDSCYLPVASPSTWTDSVAHCESLGGHLVSIRSLEEHAFVVDLILTQNLGWSNIWIGASDVAVNGTMEWVSGEPWDFENWRSGEPSGTMYDGSTEDCVVIRMNRGGKWNDINCEYKMPFFCEK